MNKKIEILITDEQYKELKWLFEQYGLRKPDWLRRKFIINQRRRKCLNDVFFESSLDDFYCSSYDGMTSSWSKTLHIAWHNLNGVIICK